jgi:hypothetical protein
VITAGKSLIIVNGDGFIHNEIDWPLPEHPMWPQFLSQFRFALAGLRGFT